MKKAIKKDNQVRGFSLVELILYVALVSIFITAAVLFAWDVIYGRVKSQVQREVSQNLRLVSKRITFEIRNASAVNSVSASDLCLASSDSSYNPTRIYLNSGRLRLGWGGGSGDCSELTSDEPLTSGEISVTDLAFTDLSSGSDSINIKFSVTVESSGGRKEWQMSETYSTSVELRSN